MRQTVGRAADDGGKRRYVFRRSFCGKRALVYAGLALGPCRRLRAVCPRAHTNTHTHTHVYTRFRSGRGREGERERGRETEKNGIVPFPLSLFLSLHTHTHTDIHTDTHTHLICIAPSHSSARSTLSRLSPVSRSLSNRCQGAAPFHPRFFSLKYLLQRITAMNSVRYHAL